VWVEVREGKIEILLIFVGWIFYMTVSLINISPSFRMELAVNENFVYVVAGVNSIDKFHQVPIKLITTESSI
jgi:hypothetical protein